MGEKTYSRILQELRSQDLSRLEPLRIAVLRNIVIEPVEPYLAHLAFEMGYRGEVCFGEFDNVVQEAIGGTSDLLNNQVACVLVFLSLAGVSWDLARNFASLDRASVSSETERISQLVESVLSGIRRQTSAMILWHGFETPLYPAFGSLDHVREPGQIATIQALNQQVREKLNLGGNAYFVDLDLCRARVGGKSFYDLRYLHIGRAPYSREGLLEIAREDFKLIRASRGRNRKCLVLDCDNVLWGGVVAEDGLARIQLGRTYPGSAFYDFQQEVLNLVSQGVLVALCSRNRAEDVWEVFDRHPDMLLRREHIAAWRINFLDKATNLRELAAELRLGLEHLAFVDDEEYEIDLVRQLVPEVAVLHLPRTLAVENRDRLAACGWFDALALTEEDRQRGALYRGEADRRQLLSEVRDLPSYLQSLEMALEIGRANELTLPRIAQLCQRTNQFNLSVRRHGESLLAELARRDDHDVLSLRLVDRFGDCGIVGTAILRYEGADVVFDTLMLSCRVLGRRVEDAFLAESLVMARQRGASRAIAEYVPGGKNQMVLEFLLRHGFAPAWSDGEVQRLVLELGREISSPPFFKIQRRGSEPCQAL